jgi:hypothetical protein
MKNYSGVEGVNGENKQIIHALIRSNPQTQIAF